MKSVEELLEMSKDSGHPIIRLFEEYPDKMFDVAELMAKFDLCQPTVANVLKKNKIPRVAVKRKFFYGSPLVVGKYLDLERRRNEES